MELDPFRIQRPSPVSRYKVYFYTLFVLLGVIGILLLVGAVPNPNPPAGIGLIVVSVIGCLLTRFIRGFI